MSDSEDMAAESSEADALVAAWIVRQYRAENPQAHISTCGGEVSVVSSEISDGEYGCETGCEFVRLEAALTCSCGESANFEYGTFGDIAGIIEDLLVGREP